MALRGSEAGVCLSSPFLPDSPPVIAIVVSMLRGVKGSDPRAGMAVTQIGKPIFECLGLANFEHV